MNRITLIYFLIQGGGLVYLGTGLGVEIILLGLFLIIISILHLLWRNRTIKLLLYLSFIVYSILSFILSILLFTFTLKVNDHIWAYTILLGIPFTNLVLSYRYIRQYNKNR